MKKTVLAIAALAAFSVQPSHAGIGNVQSSDAASPKPASRTIVGTVVEQIQYSALVIITQAAKVGEKHPKYQYSKKPSDKCETLEENSTDEADIAEAVSNDPVGPEPLYFGF